MRPGWTVALMTAEAKKRLKRRAKFYGVPLSSILSELAEQFCEGMAGPERDVILRGAWARSAGWRKQNMKGDEA